MPLLLLHATKVCSFSIHLRSICSFKTSDIVIAAAVRTPITSFQQQLAPLTASQLAHKVIEYATKQAAIPKKYLQQLYMGNTLSPGVRKILETESASICDLPENICCTAIRSGDVSGLHAIIFAAETVQAGQATAAIAGGMESMSSVTYKVPKIVAQNQDHVDHIDTVDCKNLHILTQYLGIDYAEVKAHIIETHKRAAAAWKAGHFDAEVTTVQIQEPGKRPLMVAEDELYDLKNTAELTELNDDGDGAAAVVLTTRAIADELHIKPLARIVSYRNLAPVSLTPNYTRGSLQAVTEMLVNADISADQIAMWETQDTYNILPLILNKHLNVPLTRINMHGGVPAFCNPIGMSGARLVTHLAHALPAGKFGCAIASETDGNAGVVLIEKYENKNVGPGNLPLLTLYTKDPCPLCDMLLEELETHFAGQYKLEKVYITEKENVRFLRLYRHDIPVLFLNGQFLCMHRLNVNLLRYKLQAMNAVT